MCVCMYIKCQKCNIKFISLKEKEKSRSIALSQFFYVGFSKANLEILISNVHIRIPLKGGSNQENLKIFFYIFCISKVCRKSACKTILQYSKC